MFVLLSNLHCLNQLFILPIYCFFSNHWSLCYVRHIIRYIILLLNQINIGPNCMSTRTLSWSGVDLRLSLGNLFESPCGIRAERQRKREKRGKRRQRVQGSAYMYCNVANRLAKSSQHRMIHSSRT